MTGTQVLVVDVPSSEWLSANGRTHWAEKARRTRALRTRAAYLARNQHIQPVTGRVRVIAYITYPTMRAADPGNASPTVKALIDGCTDAHVWPDDNSDWLTGPDYRRHTPFRTLAKGWHRVTLEIEEEES